MTFEQSDAASLKTWLHFISTPNIGSIKACQLLAAFGLPEQILAQSATRLTELVGAEASRALLRKPSESEENFYAQTLEWACQDNNYLLTLADSRYPKGLLECADPPPILYAKGRLDTLLPSAIAIVGSRNATTQGIKNAEAFAHILANHGQVIISGMALGIDAAAHRGALAVGVCRTIAVVGTGLDSVYPARHRDLAHQIAEQGLLLSELPLGSKALAHHFPRRNRIISALSRGVLVVEAAAQSGSLITARQAAEQGREVFAIPGSIHSPLAKGCHALIKQGAKLVESAQDILDELGHLITLNESSPQIELSTENPILSLMGHDPISFDVLQGLTQYSVGELMGLLLELELNGQLQKLADGRYQRLN